MSRPDAVAAAWPALLRLRDSGSLVTAFDEVCRLIGVMPADRMGVAGLLLATVDPKVLTAAHPDLRTLRVVVTGNATCATIVAPLRAECAKHRIVLDAPPCDYGRYVTDLGDPTSPVYRDQPDLVACVLSPDVILGELPSVWTAEDAEQALHDVYTRIAALTAQFDEAATGTLVLHTIPLPRWVARQLVDYGSRARLGIAWRTFNSDLLRLTRLRRRCVVLDLDPCLSTDAALDEPRLRAYVDVGYSEQLIGHLAAEVAHVSKALTGRDRKCLVVDLDGTLWGGVLGDDGTTGVEVGATGRGAAFNAFQRIVAQLGSQGVLLAVASKNDEVLVRAAFQERPEMTLCFDDFAAVRADWAPKDANVRALAEELDIGLDSVVFVDDSAFEAGLIRDRLPEVAVVELDDEPAWHLYRLLDQDWFSRLTTTETDRTRRDLHRAEASRRADRLAASSLTEYLTGLDLSVEVFIPGDADFARLAQLTQRTNQFNLTSVRLTEADVRDRAANREHRIWAIRAIDRYGDHGIVGAVLARVEPNRTLIIESMLLSCRVFDRGIEAAALGAIVDFAGGAGLHGLVGHYRRSPRNGRFADFYERNDFRPAGAVGDIERYRHDLRTPATLVPHVRLRSRLSENS